VLLLVLVPLRCLSLLLMFFPRVRWFLLIQPLALGGVLGAHQQALERMVVGDEWEIITPGAFAYGQCRGGPL
jgi:hypothetical protein